MTLKGVTQPFPHSRLGNASLPPPISCSAHLPSNIVLQFITLISHLAVLITKLLQPPRSYAGLQANWGSSSLDKRAAL